eukprot:CAMPEP_0176294708 /NCGR_PEP_ID=MMETSP0121_2-20121125/57280_1 /TAXON_ID=160619 /ORGANISM="Kryptoperidinium foliaceum, Strain CCMP 1326" /LENGTH=305 /DNA_ID=CAMNT_0017635743 /DNA_START=52 /DNA_END=965 /DNA_ORIENTATION=-
MTQASESVEPWAASNIVIVRDLQAAEKNFGRVQLARDDRRFLAVKRMPTSWLCSGPRVFERRHAGAKERPWVDVGLVRLLATLDYPYACRMHGIFHCGDETLVATSYCDGGDLFEWCVHKSTPPPGRRREARMRPIVAQALDAVRWLHDLDVAHRDLSVENILLVKSGELMELKLIDFGMSTLGRMTRSDVRGKLSYQAPEFYTSIHVDTFSADTFALGVVLFAMAVGVYPWTCTQPGRCPAFQLVLANGLRHLLRKRCLRHCSGQTLAELMSPSFVDVVDAMLQPTPKKRACLGEVCFQPDLQR